jgi:hypothetical protein
MHFFKGPRAKIATGRCLSELFEPLPQYGPGLARSPADEDIRMESALLILDTVPVRDVTGYIAALKETFGAIMNITQYDRYPANVHIYRSAIIRNNGNVLTPVATVFVMV